MSARSARKVKKKANWPLRILAIAGVAFVFIQIWRMQDQLSLKEQEVQDLADKKHAQAIQNEDTQAQIDAVKNLEPGEENPVLEKKAYDAGFCYPGQQVIEEAAG